MDKATVILIAAVVAAVAAITTAFLTHFFTRQREEFRHSRDRKVDHSRWLRENRQEAYHNATKFLFWVPLSVNI